MNQSHRNNNHDLGISEEGLFTFRRVKIFFPVVALLGMAILSRMPYEFHRLLFSTTVLGAIDLRLRFDEVQLWFAGTHVYSVLKSAVYPPASYTIMWPFMGFSSWQPVRWVWAFSSIVFLVYLIKALLTQNIPENSRSRLFWGMFIIAHYGTAITLGNGQLTIHIMAAIVGCVVLISTQKSNLKTDLLVGFLSALSLVKPTVSLPYMWLILFIPKNIYPALATAFFYIILALIASLFQSRGFLQLHLDWLESGVSAASWSSVNNTGSRNVEFLSEDIGYGDVHALLANLDLSHLAMPISLGLLALFGLWLYFYRNCNIWVLLGVASIIARTWTYHRVYDDMLIIFSIFGIVSVLRNNLNHKLNKQGKYLLIVLIVASLIPASLRLMPTPIDLLFQGGQTALWVIALIYLMHSAYMEKQVMQNQDKTVMTNT